MENLSILLIFGLIALAAKDIGNGFRKLGLPLISGFLFVGMLAGPYVLGILDENTSEVLRFVDEVALAFIAFAAGGELHLEELRRNLHRVAAILAGLTLVVFVLGVLAFQLLAGMIPFMRDMSRAEMVAVAILGATILVARSPSSAYAVIKELRAKGPFTQTVLGVTVLMDSVVIVVFAVSVSVADVLLKGASFSLVLLSFLLFEIVLDVAFGLAVGWMLGLCLSLRLHARYKSALVLLVGYSVFALSFFLREVHLGSLPVSVFSEPLLICMVAGFTVTNYTRYRAEFRKTVEEIAPAVFVLFFTLVGAGLELDVLRRSWMAALALVLVRALGIFIGSYLGGAVSGGLPQHNRVLGLTFITQAGVSLGLAREVGVEFPPWGNEFVTLAVAVIVVNQLVGPALFKWAIQLVGEAHLRAETSGFDGVRDALIFGVEGQSLALARQLKAHGWQVKLADLDAHPINDLSPMDVEVHSVREITPAELRKLGADKAEAIVAMLTDDEVNYRICEVAYEHFGTENVVVRLNDRANMGRFHELGVLIVDPSTAVVSLLDHFVRSPSATSLLLGLEEDQDVIEVVVRDRRLHGIALRDLRLPTDTLVLAIRRRGHLLISHGYTRLELGDEITVVGSPESLEEVALLFEA